MLSDEAAWLSLRRPAVRQELARAWSRRLPGAARRRALRRSIRGTKHSIWWRASSLASGAISEPSHFGGSYGWASAGRFHHAQSQLRRFLNPDRRLRAPRRRLQRPRRPRPHAVYRGAARGVAGQPHELGGAREALQAFVSFGGVPRKNGQINSGGAIVHHVKGGLSACATQESRFSVNATPTAQDLDTGGDVEWLAIRPGTDAALDACALRHAAVEGRDDQALPRPLHGGLRRSSVPISAANAHGQPRTPGGPRRSPASPPIASSPWRARIWPSCTMLSIGWSLQRAEHGEQPFWIAMTLAGMLGQIGLPGGGFACGYGPSTDGHGALRHSGPTCRRVPTRYPTSFRPQYLRHAAASR